MRRAATHFQIHLSTCLILMFLSGVLMSVYFQFVKVLASSEFFMESHRSTFAMHSSFIAFAVSILAGAAVVVERLNAAPAPATAKMCPTQHR